MGSGGGGGGGGSDNAFTPDRRLREEEARRGREFEKQQLKKSAEALQAKDRAGSTRDPDFGAKAPAPAPQMGRSPAAFQAMLGSTGQGAKDAAALAGRSEFGSKSNFNALGKMVTEARGETSMVIPSITTAGGAVVKKKMNEAMLQKVIAGGKPVFKDGNIVGVDEDGTYTGMASASPYKNVPTTEQETRDDPMPSEPKIEDEPDEVEPVIAGSGRSTKAGRGKGRRGVAFGTRRSLVNLRSLGKRGLG